MLPRALRDALSRLLDVAPERIHDGRGPIWPSHRLYVCVGLPGSEGSEGVVALLIRGGEITHPARPSYKAEGCAWSDQVILLPFHRTYVSGDKPEGSPTTLSEALRRAGPRQGDLVVVRRWSLLPNPNVIRHLPEVFVFPA